jgi:hypothetical protein
VLDSVWKEEIDVKVPSELSSGKTYTKAIQTKQKLPQTKNTFDLRLAFFSSTMYGVEYAIAQFSNQLLAVVRLKHFARAFSGNSSPVTTHATGPQELAKKKMYMHTKAMDAFCDERSVAGEPVASEAVPTEPTMNWQTHMPIAPIRSRPRRPSLSTRYKPGSVEATLTEFVITWMMKGFWNPAFLKY